jgi:hypothetical protein
MVAVVVILDEMISTGLLLVGRDLPSVNSRKTSVRLPACLFCQACKIVYSDVPSKGHGISIIFTAWLVQHFWVKK